ncbi:tRNA splicing endonuclease subunit sen2 [Coemansia sp. RSA 988]|nr:tRNA splicing endonuclease subunit sen2 [Coemansia sp. RSA 988]
MTWHPAILPRIGRLLEKFGHLLDGTSHIWLLAASARHLRHLDKLLPGSLCRTIQRIWKAATFSMQRMWYQVAPGNLLWPTLVPVRMKANVHIINIDSKPSDCWIWICEGQKILWRSGSFGKGILSRSTPTWKQRYQRETVEQSTENKPQEIYIEDITQRRREARQQMRRNAEDKQHKEGNIATVGDSSNVINSQDAMRLETMGGLEVTQNEVDAMEPVQLSPFEALFLSDIGCLDVLDASHEDRCLTHAELYALLCTCHKSDDFELKYAAYYYYRAKGWVVRSGLKFGSDFLLYGKGGPARSHSQYSVIVRRPEQQKLNDTMDLEDSWQYMFALSRVCTQVRKSLIVCYVNPPESNHQANILPALEQYEIQEYLFKRFNPNRK